MTCMSCVKLIKDNLKSFSGLINIEIYFEDGKAFLEYDNNDTSSDIIINRINQMGFDCILLEDKFSMCDSKPLCMLQNNIIIIIYILLGLQLFFVSNYI